MSVLITGGTGFVGLNVAEELLRRGTDVLLLDVGPLPPEAARTFFCLPGKFTTLYGSVTDPGVVTHILRTHDVAAIVHAAAITPGLERERWDARSVFEINTIGTVNLLEKARDHGVRRFIYLSSASVYGLNAYDVEFLDEEKTQPLPATLYAISKYAAERAVLRWRDLWGLEAVVFRLGAVFGPWERDTGHRDVLSPPLQAIRLALRGDTVRLPRTGLNHWVYSRDVAGAVAHWLEVGPQKHDVYNVGGPDLWTMDVWCQHLSERFPKVTYEISGPDNANVNYFDSRDRAALSIERLRNDLGYQPVFGLEAALEDYLRWLDRVAGDWAM